MTEKQALDNVFEWTVRSIEAAYAESDNPRERRLMLEKILREAAGRVDEIKQRQKV